MYFRLPEDVYLTFFCEDLIALDLKKDRYLILSKKISDSLLISLSNVFVMKDGKYVPFESDVILPENFDLSIQCLKNYRLLCEREHDYPSAKIPLHKNSAGADNLDWRMPAGELDKKVSKFLVLEAYLTLIRVYFLLRILGFSALIRAIRKKSKRCTQQGPEVFSDLATALNQACFFFPVKTKCLEWAATLTLMGLKRRLVCNLEIGVQNSPFLAHAWVKVGRNVIADDEALPKMLSVILSEPFL